MKILITGGAGFIGSNFIRYILKKYKNYKIFNLDKLTYCGNLNNLRDVEKNPNYYFFKGDICDKKIVEKLVKKVDAIINFAAESHVDRSILEPESFIKTNFFGTYVLLEAGKKYKIKKFIQIGTDEEYGSIKKGYFKETDPLNPSSPYSASKAGASLLSLSYFKTFKLPVIVTRSTNNFGPYQYPEKIIPLFITNLLEGKKVPLYGKGLQRRDWLYVLDNCKAIDLIFHKGKIGEIYNVAGGNELSNKDLTKIILKKLGKDESWIEYVKDRPGHDFRYGIDCQKIKKLGWRPIYNFEKALDETINWYKNNEWWWKPIKSGEFLKYYQKQYGKKK
jgi:dTDP-glucose 4,6-dehydratase